jgi:hypothetical protein
MKTFMISQDPSFPNLSNKFHIQNLGQKMFEGWATNLSWAYRHASISFFYGFNWVAYDEV